MKLMKFKFPDEREIMKQAKEEYVRHCENDDHVNIVSPFPSVG